MAYKSVNVEITQEHFDRSIKGSPKEAVKELIWNACDADAKNIEVSFDYDGIAGAESVSDIYVKDDGHGIAIGKLGQGRYKSLAAGNFLDWDSVFQDESGTLLHCEIHINSASRMNISYSETADKAEAEHTGTIVHIHGIPDEKIGFITKMAEPMETIPDLLATFAPYLLAYTNITIKYNGVTVDPAQQIKSQEDQELVYEEDGKEPIKARLSAITWKEAQFNKLYICGSSGVVYAEMDYTPLKRTSTSLYLMGDLFEQMHRDNTLAMGNTNPAYAYFEEEAKKFARALVGEQEEEDAAVEIARIKEEGIYPYDGEPEDDMKKAERDVFDVFAVQVNRAVPQLKSSSRQTKKLTYHLMREAINTNPASIKTILTEVFNLTQQQQDDLAELLTHTSLPDIIDTAKTVSDRFHKVLLKELWIFGEKYTLGTSDQSLRNLLKAHLNCLGRDELTPEIPPEAVEDLTRIPDLCLFQQICPSYENFEHLVIELKRPTLTLTLKEMDQIRDYALTVAENPMFDKTRTKWHFVLLGQRLDQHVQRALRNQTVGEGNFYNADNVSISVFEWSKIIQDNKLKYEYLRRKLNHQLSSDPNFASDYLRTKHAELFPTEE